jgi:hypothetical protein
MIIQYKKTEHGDKNLGIRILLFDVKQNFANN